MNILITGGIGYIESHITLELIKKGVRDYVHISDLANIHVPIIEDYNPGYSVYNVGSGVGTSTQEIINIFNSYLPKLKYEFANARDGDIGNIFADITKIKNDYNFNPNLNLNEIPDSTIIDWTLRIKCFKNPI